MASAQDIKNRIPITGALMLATLMVTLDSTIANVALPHMQGSISASQEQITWVLTSYILATAVMTPLSGWLSMKIGRKRMLVYSVIAFTLASMLCGIATTVPEMVVFRLLQGIAGASLMPLSQAIMLDLYPPHMVPRVMSIWSAAVILGPIAGPTIGGWITEHLDWRWVFFINLPIGIVTALGLQSAMSADSGGRERPFDFVGFGALIAFVVGFQVLLDRGPSQDWYTSLEIWIETAIAAAGLWVFVLQTISAKHPFFHRALAKDANFIATTVFSFCVGALLFSTTALLPSFMQNLMGYSAMQSGVASMPRGIGSLISFLLVPFLMARLGARRVLLVGLVGCLWSLWMMGQFNLNMADGPIIVSGFIQGLGTGLLFAPLSMLAYATLDQSHRVEGTIVSTMARSLGSSVGISLVQTMVIRTGALAHTEIAGRISQADPVMKSLLPPMMDPTRPEGLQMLNAEVTRQASMIGYANVFSWMLVATVVLGPLILILKPAPPLQRPSAADAHAEQLRAGS